MKAYLASDFDSADFKADASSKELKPLMVSSRAFLTDSDFNPVRFTLRQIKAHGVKKAKELSAQYKCKVNLKGIRDCGDYWTITIG